MRHIRVATRVLELPYRSRAMGATMADTLESLAGEVDPMVRAKVAR